MRKNSLLSFTLKTGEDAFELFIGGGEAFAEGFDEFGGKAGERNHRVDVAVSALELCNNLFEFGELF